MPAPGVKVEVTGVRELNKALKKVDTNLSKELKTGFKGIAQHVVDRVKPKVPRRSGKAASSYKARGTQRGGAIAFGGTKAEYAPWLDFGGGKAGARGVTSSDPIGHKKSTTGFKRPFIKEGRYLYPTIVEERDEIIHMTDQLVEHVVKSAGFDTEGEL